MRQLVRPPMRAQLNLSSRAGTNKWKYHLSTFGVISGDTGSFVPCAFLIHKFEDAHILRDAMDCLGFALARLQNDGSDAAAAAAVRLFCPRFILIDVSAAETLAVHTCIWGRQWVASVLCEISTTEPSARCREW